MAEATPFLPGLSPIRSKSLTAAQDAGNLSSNGGLVVLREAARRLDLAAVIADVKASPPADPDNPVLVAGEKERITRAKRLADGIPVDATTWGNLVEAARSLGINAVPQAR